MQDRREGLAGSVTRVLALCANRMRHVSVVACGVFLCGVSFSQSLVQMREYYNADLDYYFVTARINEQVLLLSTGKWSETGQSFKMFDGQTSKANAALTRFFFPEVALGATRGSHFYTPISSEASLVRAQNPANTTVRGKPVDEGVVGYVTPPTGQTCPTGTQPVFRSFRSDATSKDNPNHRYTTDAEMHRTMVNFGWADEGVAFCSEKWAIAPPSVEQFGDVFSSRYRGDYNGRLSKEGNSYYLSSAAAAVGDFFWDGDDAHYREVLAVESVGGRQLLLSTLANPAQVIIGIVQNTSPKRTRPKSYSAAPAIKVDLCGHSVANEITSEASDSDESFSVEIFCSKKNNSTGTGSKYGGKISITHSPPEFTFARAEAGACSFAGCTQSPQFVISQTKPAKTQATVTVNFEGNGEIFDTEPKRILNKIVWVNGSPVHVYLYWQADGTIAGTLEGSWDFGLSPTASTNSNDADAKARELTTSMRQSSSADPKESTWKVSSDVSFTFGAKIVAGVATPINTEIHCVGRDDLACDFGRQIDTHVRGEVIAGMELKLNPSGHLQGGVATTSAGPCLDISVDASVDALAAVRLLGRDASLVLPIYEKSWPIIDNRCLRDTRPAPVKISHSYRADRADEIVLLESADARALAGKTTTTKAFTVSSLIMLPQLKVTLPTGWSITSPDIGVQISSAGTANEHIVYVPLLAQRLTLALKSNELFAVPATVIIPIDNGGTLGNARASYRTLVDGTSGPRLEMSIAAEAPYLQSFLRYDVEINGRTVATAPLNSNAININPVVGSPVQSPSSVKVYLYTLAKKYEILATAQQAAAQPTSLALRDLTISSGRLSGRVAILGNSFAGKIQVSAYDDQQNLASCEWSTSAQRFDGGSDVAIPECEALIARAIRLVVLVRAIDTTGREIARTTGTVNVRNGVPITVRSLSAVQSSPGSAVRVSFIVDVVGFSPVSVRVTAGDSQTGVHACELNAGAAVGAQSFPFMGDWASVNGLSCSALLPATGSKLIWFRVEARDTGGNTGNNGVMPTASAQFSRSQLIRVDGVCGASNGSQFTSAPTANLCLVGTPSAVAGAGPWTWTCTGSNGGTNAPCTATKAPTALALTAVSPTNVNAGTTVPYSPVLTLTGSGLDAATTIEWRDSGVVYATWTRTSLVSGFSTWTSSSGATITNVAQSATQMTVTPTLVRVGDTWTGTHTWTVTVSGAGGSASASFTVTRSAVPTPVNGVCGASNGSQFTSAPTANLCLVGTPSAVAGAGPWTWTCTGSNGGTTAPCSATKAPTALALTAVSPTSFNAGTAVPYSSVLTLTGSGLDSATTIEWRDSGVVYATWTRTSLVSGVSTWTSSSGATITNVAHSATQMTVTPTLVKVGDTWTGTHTWTVTVSGAAGSASTTFTVTRTASPTPINGVCGVASTKQYTSAPPQAELCSAGTPGPVTGTGPWSWTCNGSNGGTSINCSAGLAPVLPAPPTASVASVSTGVQITWSTVSGATGYRIYRGGSLLFTVGSGTQSSYIDTAVAAGGNYCYTVSSTTTFTTPPSESAQTSAGCTIYSPGPAPLTAPSGVSATAITSGIRITWSPVSGADSYLLTRLNDNVVWTLGSSTTSYDDTTGLVPGVGYGYVVNAKRGSETSPQSVIVNAVAPTPPVNGACGSANGATFTSKPTTNLCNAGTPSLVNGTGPWSWTCNGSNGGTSASCAASLAAPNPTALSPRTATKSATTTVTVQINVLGTNLPTTLALGIADLTCTNDNWLGSTTNIPFQCTITSSVVKGTKNVVIKDQPNGALLASWPSYFTVN